MLTTKLLPTEVSARTRITAADTQKGFMISTLRLAYAKIEQRGARDWPFSLTSWLSICPAQQGELLTASRFSHARTIVV
jgi:hypothetical protein